MTDYTFNVVKSDGTTVAEVIKAASFTAALAILNAKHPPTAQSVYRNLRK